LLLLVIKNQEFSNSGKDMTSATPQRGVHQILYDQGILGVEILEDIGRAG